MGLEFHAELHPRAEDVARVAALAPENPFYTEGYCKAMRAMGLHPIILSLRDGACVASACVASLSRGRIGRALEIESLPAAGPDGEFWRGLAAFCERGGIGHLSINSYASRPASIPPLPGELGRRPRREYVLDLEGPSLWTCLRENHRRRIKLARRNGLQVRRSTDPADCPTHAAMMAASIARRRARGEEVGDDDRLQECTALLREGAGELFQATSDGRVLSSALVLLANRGAYYQTSGTSPEGMERGASHFLIQEIAVALRARGLRTLNLGGADAGSPGLAGFKAGFGATPVDLEAAQSYRGGAVRKSLAAAAGWLRDARATRLLRSPARAPGSSPAGPQPAPADR